MKLLKLIAFFVSLAGFTNAQYWAPDNAVWHVGIIDNFFSASQSYLKIEVAGDTLIQGQNCKIMQKTMYNSTGTVLNNGNEYMYHDNGKVYHFSNNSFYTLYDFNTNPGDSWTVSVPFASPWCGGGMSACDTLINIVVDSVSSITVQGQVLKTLYVHSVNNDWQFMNPIIENIGSSGGLFPFIYSYMDINIPYLRCYSDSLIFYQTNFSISGGCDTLVTGINNAGNNHLVNVYPNPVTDYLNVSTDLNQSTITVYDLTSKELLTREFNYSTKLDLSALSRGFYFYRISLDDGRFSRGVVIKD